MAINRHGRSEDHRVDRGHAVVVEDGGSWEGRHVNRGYTVVGEDGGGYEGRRVNQGLRAGFDGLVPA